MSTTAVEPVRFVAAHGRRALVMGYGGPDAGLEIWAYPLQLVRNYRVSFLVPGTTGALDGASLLRRIEYRPSEIIRTYIGPNFLVREHLFVPLDRPAAILTYEVEGRAAPDIRISFLPVMNLMWPGALGGQDVRWSGSLPGYLLSEQSAHFSAEVASPDVVAHSDVGNSTLRTSLAQSLVLRPKAAHGALPGSMSARQARLYIGLNAEPGDLQPGNLQSDTDGRATLRRLEQQTDSLRTSAQAHYADLLRNTLRIHTPDEQVNRALAWSEVALDQAWVCNPQLGCGIVAGYGPSRGERRPQYAWFFAGDGLIATDALVATGEYARARDELAFILKYQNPANGMIWHELSQAAGFLDWAGKYPYMFVHVDITFAFLPAMDHYLSASGDTGFIAANWTRIAAAYRYCRSVVDPATGLPTIPPGKEGGDEQTRMRDDIGLSSSWLAATAAYASLAEATGHHAEAAQAKLEHARTAHSIAAQDWDPATGFWLAGHTVTGAPIKDLRSRPAALLSQHVFSPAQQDSILNRLASSDFQTDWGTRSLSATSPDFNPDSYSRGSVSALGTADLATAFWAAHRPVAAWQMWSALLPWFHLDSLGHMHEVLAGDFFHQQVESVPEQTWSSAGFLQATVQGLLGISIEAAPAALVLAPHLPSEWNTVSIDNLRVGSARLSAQLEQHPGELDLTLTNDGAPVEVRFAPQVPLGASKLHAQVNGRAIPVRAEPSGQEQPGPEQPNSDQHAQVRFQALHGITRCGIRYQGGVEVWLAAPDLHHDLQHDLPQHDLQPGDASSPARLTGIRFAQGVLTLDADTVPDIPSSVTIRTLWKPATVHGAVVSPLAGNLYRVTFENHSGSAKGHSPVQASIVFR